VRALVGRLEVKPNLRGADRIMPPLSTQNTPELTTEEVQAILVQPLEFASVLLASGPRIFDTPGRPVRVPKLTAGVDPDWIGENEQITEKDADFGEVTLLPDTMKSAKVISRFSNELARSSVVALDAALRARLVSDVAAKLDHAFFAGEGGAPAGTEPLGILEFAGTQEIPAVGAISLDDLHDAEGLALAAAVDPSKLTWFVRPETFTALRKLKDGAQRYQLTPDPTQAGVLTLLGHPVRITDRLPVDAVPDPDVTSLVLADVSTIAVARDLAPSVTLLAERYADFDQLAIRVVARYDLAPLLPEAVVKLTGVTV
jgi:HK97 family phage major capsid protein